MCVRHAPVLCVHQQAGNQLCTTSIKVVPCPCNTAPQPACQHVLHRLVMHCNSQICSPNGQRLAQSAYAKLVPCPLESLQHCTALFHYYRWPELALCPSRDVVPAPEASPQEAAVKVLHGFTDSARNFQARPSACLL